MPLELPPQQFLTVKELASWLGLDRRQIAQLVADKTFASPIKVGKRGRVWSREDCGWMAYRLKASQRFAGGKTDEIEDDIDSE